MKWKMSDRSMFAVLLRSPWWVSFIVVAAISLASSALLPTEYKLMGALCSFPFAVIGVMAAWRQRSHLSSAQADALQSDLAKMHWREFSPLLSQAFVRQGLHRDGVDQWRGRLHIDAAGSNHSGVRQTMEGGGLGCR